MNEKISSELQLNINRLNQTLFIGKNFDLKHRTFYVGGKELCLYYIDGFLDDHTMERFMEVFIRIKPEDMPNTPHEFSKRFLPYGSVLLLDDYDQIIRGILSGIACILVDGYEQAFMIDCRHYPMRGVEEPEKDRVLRGSRDGFVETLVCNTALIRRRIRSPELIMEMLYVGKSSQTNVVLSYLDSRVDHEFLDKLRKRIQDIEVDSLTMN
ncbi:spore germination protein, partial [Lachnotalea glycerini]